MVDKKDKRDDRRGGFYWLDEKPYVSVTAVLKILDKPALRYWFGREVYLAMVKDPTLSEGEAMSAPYKVTSGAQERGKTIHSLIEAYKKTGTIVDLDTIPPALRGYAKAFYTWIGDNKIEIIESEKTVVNEGYGYAGTLDLLARVNGESYLIDAKTGKDIYAESTLQLSAYQAALDGVLPKVGVLLLKEDGDYKFATVNPRFDVFLSCKALWEWFNEDLIKKVGYEGGGK